MLADNNVHNPQVSYFDCKPLYWKKFQYTINIFDRIIKLKVYFTCRAFSLPFLMAEVSLEGGIGEAACTGSKISLVLIKGT